MTAPPHGDFRAGLIGFNPANKKASLRLQGGLFVGRISMNYAYRAAGLMAGVFGSTMAAFTASTLSA